MLKRFPHILSYVTDGTPGGWNDNTGLPTEGTPGATVTVACRAEPNVRQSYVIRENDGQRIEFDYLIHMDKSSALIPFGKSVTITDGGSQIASGTVVRSHKNQVHNQSWI